MNLNDVGSYGGGGGDAGDGGGVSCGGLVRGQLDNEVLRGERVGYLCCSPTVPQSQYAVGPILPTLAASAGLPTLLSLCCQCGGGGSQASKL